MIDGVEKYDTAEILEDSIRQCAHSNDHVSLNNYYTMIFSVNILLFMLIVIVLGY